MSNFKLRPHQEIIVHELRKAWKQNRTHLIASPTGSGKTAIAAFIIKGFVDRGLRVCFIAPYVELIAQTDNRFQSYGLPEAGFIWQDNKPDEFALIQIASADTLIRRDARTDIDLYIIDEAHLKRVKLLDWMALSDKPWIGLTATPYTTWLGEHYSNFINTCTMNDLIEAGELTPFKAFAPAVPDLTGVKIKRGDYDEAAIDAIMRGSKLVGDVVKTWCDIGENRKSIAFCCSVLHAGEVCNNFNQIGIKAEMIVGTTPKEEREAILNRFRDGITTVLTNVFCLTAGLDVPEVSCILWCRPTKSEIMFQQGCGRGVRTFKGKDNCLLLDFSGSVLRLGMPNDIHYEDLLTEDDGLDQAQRKAKEKSKLEKLPKLCHVCSFVKPAGQYVCGQCGNKPIAGEDVDADLTRSLVSIDGKEKKHSKAEMQQFYSELIGFNKMAENEGKKPVSLYYTFKGKFKCDPPRGISKASKQPSIPTTQYIKSRRVAYAKSMRKASS